MPALVEVYIQVCSCSPAIGACAQAEIYHSCFGFNTCMTISVATQGSI